MSIQPIRKHVAPEIPDKLYFRIGDVARLCEVPAYVLRFWETEFPQLKPNKGGTGQRLYRKRDVEMALRIKSLLYDQGYTIPGARQVFKSEAKAREFTVTEAAQPMPLVDVEQAPKTKIARVAEANSAEDVRRTAALRAMADELRSMLGLLEKPLGSFVGRTEKPAPKLQALRPRLMLEPRPMPVPMESLRLVVDPRLQGDLFPGE